MKFSASVNLPIIVFLTGLSGLSVAKEDLPDVTLEGLHHLRDTNLAMVYADPGIDLSDYNRIYLDDVYVAFKKNWQRSQNRIVPNKITAGDMAKIKAELALLFRDVFTKTLEEGGYELVYERAEDVLLVKPAIINLDIIAPTTTTAVNSQTYAESAGEMTLYLELYDSLTGDLLAKALDRQMDRQTGYFQWQNRVSNRAAANRIMQVWANVLKQGLDEAKGIKPLP